MNDLKAMGQAGELIEKIKNLIGIVGQRTKTECQKIIEDATSGKLKLSADEVMVLRAIHHLGGNVPVKRVVERLAELKDETVHPSTVSLTMKRYRTHGLLTIERKKIDKRQPLNTLTPRGEKLARRLDEVDAVVLKNVIDSLRLDEPLVADLCLRLDRANERIREQLHREQQQSKPSIAGVYDYALGGVCHTYLDRKWVDEEAQILPKRRQSAEANRAFLQRAVYFLAKEKGITQFLDIGSGFPTNRNTHEVALELKPASITYVDNDPEVVRVSRNLLHDEENVRVVQQDLRCIKTWLKGDRFQNIDLTKPVAILLVAILHFVTDDSEVREILEFLKQKLAPGSYLVISHVSTDRMDKEGHTLLAKYNRRVGDVKPRTQKELAALLEGFELLDRGLVFISDWKRDLPDRLAGKYIPPQNSSLVACVVKL